MPGENLEAVFTPIVRAAIYVVGALVIVGLFACVAWG